MNMELTWAEARALFGIEQISLDRAALLLALERGSWNQQEFSDEERSPFLADESTWRATHKMQPELAKGALKLAVKALSDLLVGEVEAKRLEAILCGRELTGRIDPKRTYIPIEALPEFAFQYDLELGDLWEDYCEREDKITAHTQSAAEAARRKAEMGEPMIGRGSAADFEALPEWAQDYIRELLDSRLRPAAPVVRETHRAPGIRETRTLLNVIGALVETYLGTSPGGQRYSAFSSQAALVDTLVARYPSAAGLSQRTLEGLFPKARKSLQQD